MLKLYKKHKKIIDSIISHLIVLVVGAGAGYTIKIAITTTKEVNTSNTQAPCSISTSGQTGDNNIKDCNTGPKSEVSFIYATSTLDNRSQTYNNILQFDVLNPVLGANTPIITLPDNIRADKPFVVTPTACGTLMISNVPNIPFCGYESSFVTRNKVSEKDFANIRVNL